MSTLIVLTEAGCGGGSASDAMIDVSDTACGSQLHFTGEYVDWDNDTTFCGLPGAVLSVRGTATKETLPPNGRIDLCVPNQEVTLIDVTPPSAVPDCKLDRSQPYSLPGLAVASKAVILAGGTWSGRMFVQGRESYDPTKAQVYVHIEGPARAVSLDASHSHGTVQAVAANTWAVGDTGHEVYFPDVDATGGSAQLSVSGGSVGEGSIPLVAGVMTTLTVITH